MAKRSKRRGSSKAGRKRIAGERYANGRLKPRGPNATVIAKRKAGDAEAGEHPLDFALSQSWITERQHRDAMAYRTAYSWAHIGGPRLGSGSPQEVPEETMPPLEVQMRNLSQIPDADIAAAWDKYFSEGEAEPSGRADVNTLTIWIELNRALSADERQQLFLVSIIGSWPFWMTRRSAGKELGSQDQRRLQSLLSGIARVGQVLHPPRPAATILPVPHKPARKPSTEVPVRYETTDGEPVTPQSMHGRPFEVVVTQRRRG